MDDGCYVGGRLAGAATQEDGVHAFEEDEEDGLY